jgi:hypothetical protein
MIAGKDRNGDALESRNFAALPARQPYRQLFETAKTSRRFCQGLLPECGEIGPRLRRQPAGRDRTR